MLSIVNSFITDEEQEDNQTEQTLVLYYITPCQYCEQVQERISELELDDHVEKKTTSISPYQRDELEAVSDQNRVPTLYNKKTGKTYCGLEECQEFLNTVEATSDGVTVTEGASASVAAD